MNNKMFRIGAVIVVLLLVFFLINRDDETDVPEEQAKTTVEESASKQAETDRLTKLAAKKEAEEKTAEAADLAEKKEVAKKAAAEKRRKAEKAATEMAVAEKAAEEIAATAKVALAELTAELAAADKAAEAAVVELAAAKIAFANLAAEKIAAEKATAEKAAAAQLAVDCQAKYDESQAAYKENNMQKTLASHSGVVQMGCDEELSSRSQYYIGWIYGNKLFNMDAARAEYQKGANNYTSGLKYVEKCEEKLDLYDMSDEAEAVYKADDFAKAAALREEVGNTIGCDKALAAKNLYLAGYIHQKKLNDNAKAKALYEAVVINFSGSGYDDKAQQKLATL